MSDIAVPNQSIIPEELSKSKYGTLEVFGDMSSGASWLPRLALFGSNSDLVKEGKAQMATWGLIKSKDDFEQLGKEVDIIPVSWRPKAMKLTDSPVSYFNPETPEFKDIQAKSDIQNSKCVFGPEFLIWVPSLAKFATYYMSSKSARNQAKEVLGMIGRGCTLGIKLISNKDYTWHAPVPKRCTSELTAPPQEQMGLIAKSFNEPEDSSVEFSPEKLEEESNRPR